MNAHKQQKLINLWLDNPNGTVLEGIYAGLWHEVSVSTLINEPSTTKYRINPRCQRAYDYIIEHCGDVACKIYHSWIDGAELEVKTANEWTCVDTPQFRDDMLSGFVDLYQYYDGNIRVKEQTEVMWICDTLFWETNRHHSFLPYTYIPEDKESVELSDIEHYVECDKMIKEVWHKVPTKVRAKGD